MNILDYSIAVKIFNTANTLLKSNYFNISLVSDKKEVVTEGKIHFYVEQSSNEVINEKSILIIPGSDSKESNLDKSYLINYI